MNRLTRKYDDNGTYEILENNTTCNTMYDVPWTDVSNCVDKLGKLEDIEEELGCPLEVVFKVLLKKEGIRTTKNNICYIDKIVRMSTGHLAFELAFAHYLYLKDYQKTWWLKGEKNENN